MAKNELISIYCFGEEIGKLGYDENRATSFFQYHPDLLGSGRYGNLFPFVIRRMPQVQVFTKYTSDTFRSLPPAIADSLPDVFGNMVFRTWMEQTGRQLGSISVPEQLAYVGRRGMGALEYMPAKEVTGTATIDLKEITAVVEQVLQNKGWVSAGKMDSISLLNIFKIGTSAGGVRPKILVAATNTTGEIIPGDMVYDAGYEHYLIKLGIEEGLTYSREVVEYIYYLMATAAGIDMMPAKLIEGRHFATLRFDRQGGEKKHVLTATGIAGLDHKDVAVSGYENLFDLCVSLKLPHADIEQLYRRMVFNRMFANEDDHLKNHSFIYNKEQDNWRLSPAYDITYSLNPELNFTRTQRALSVNGKRTDITTDDMLAVAAKYTVKNATGIIEEVKKVAGMWPETATAHGVPPHIIQSIERSFRIN
jgi:serine/threonine-protein kinase HipA